MAPPKKHGVDSLNSNPLALWPEDERLVAVKIAEELKTPELVAEHERHRVARGIVILQTLEAYIAEQVKDGIPLNECPILLRWPGFQNTTIRGLNQVMSRFGRLPDPEDMIDLDDLKDSEDKKA